MPFYSARPVPHGERFPRFDFGLMIFWGIVFAFIPWSIAFEISFAGGPAKYCAAGVEITSLRGPGIDYPGLALCDGSRPDYPAPYLFYIAAAVLLVIGIVGFIVRSVQLRRSRRVGQ